MDGLNFLAKGLAMVGNMMLGAGAFVFDETDEEENRNLPNITNTHISLKVSGVTYIFFVNINSVCNGRVLDQ